VMLTKRSRINGRPNRSHDKPGFLVFTRRPKMTFLPLLLLFSLLQPTHTTSVHDSSSILLAKNTDSLLATIRQAEATTEKLKLKKATASPEEDLEAEISSLKVRLKASPTSCSVVGTQKMEYSFMNGTMLVETIFFFSGSINAHFF